jgi:hypothetical protein
MAGKPTAAQLQRNYLSKDFIDLRADLVRYAQTFFPDKIRDFSEAGLGGMFIDLAASVGDTMTYYLDHQFNELSWSDSVEIDNIQRHLRNAGVKITGASPATVTLTFLVEVPASLTTNGYVPQENAIPTILAGTVTSSAGRITFTTVEDINFNERDSDGFLRATVTVGETDDSGNPLTFILTRDVTATSSVRTSETFSVPNGFNPFFTTNLSNANVSRIVSVIDTEGNQYYEVDSLTQDTVFLPVSNISYDNKTVTDSMEVIPAPRRFTTSTDLTTRLTTLTFGGGENAVDEKTVVDPSQLALPLYGRGAIPRFSLDPNALLRSKTLGIAPSNTILTVIYEYGGGLNHNVSANSIRSITSLSMIFPGLPPNAIASSVRASTDVINRTNSSGGTNQPTIQDLRLQIPAAKNSQLRIVTKEDLIARVYSLPTKFGKVAKAGCRSNPANPLAKQLYIAGYNSSGNLTRASDSLKLNLRNYLNDLRLISDAIDIVDSPIVNYAVRASIIVSPNFISLEVLQGTAQAIRDELDITNFQPDQPIVIADVTSAIINTPGVLSLVSLEFINRAGTVEDSTYSSFAYDMSLASSRGIIVPPPGGIFEILFPTQDVVVVSV